MRHASERGDLSRRSRRSSAPGDTPLAALLLVAMLAQLRAPTGIE